MASFGVLGILKAYNSVMSYEEVTEKEFSAMTVESQTHKKQHKSATMRWQTSEGL